MQDWYSFKGETKEFYGVDMTVLEVILCVGVGGV